MRAKTKVYQRATLRKIVRAHSRKRVGRAIDPFIFVGYILFMEQLMSNATRKARIEGEKVVAAKDIRKVTLSTLRRFKG